MARNLPFEIREAVVSACGKLFWLEDLFPAFLLSSGVSPDMYDRFGGEPKYKIVRHILSKLDPTGEAGSLIQHKIVTELCRLRRVPMSWALYCCSFFLYLVCSTLPQSRVGDFR